MKQIFWQQGNTFCRTSADVWVIKVRSKGFMMIVYFKTCRKYVLSTFLECEDYCSIFQPRCAVRLYISVNAAAYKIYYFYPVHILFLWYYYARCVHQRIWKHVKGSFYILETQHLWLGRGFISALNGHVLATIQWSVVSCPATPCKSAGT